jgi:hypothetical protein
VTTQRITAPKNMTPITTTEATKAYRSGLGDGGLCPGCEGVSIQSSTGFRSLRQPGPRAQAATQGAAIQLHRENVRDLNVRLIDMARENTEAAFDFAREVAAAKAPSDFLQAWTTHATKQFDTLTKQTSELTTLAQRLASTTTQQVTRSVGQGPKRE